MNEDKNYNQIIKQYENKCILDVYNSLSKLFTSPPMRDLAFDFEKIKALNSKLIKKIVICVTSTKCVSLLHDV